MFVPLRKPKPTRPARLSPGCSVYKFSNLLYTTLSVPNMLLDEIGVGAGARVSLLIGTEDEAGWVAIVPGDDFAVRRSKADSSVSSISTPRIPTTRVHGIVDLEYRIDKDNKSILLRLPDLEAAE